MSSPFNLEICFEKNSWLNKSLMQNYKLKFGSTLKTSKLVFIVILICISNNIKDAPFEDRFRWSRIIKILKSIIQNNYWYLYRKCKIIFQIGKWLHSHRIYQLETDKWLNLCVSTKTRRTLSKPLSQRMFCWSFQ